MHDIEELINEAAEAGEVKRAVSVKRGRQGGSPAPICQVLNVALPYVSQGKGQYEAEGAAALRMKVSWEQGLFAGGGARGAAALDGRAGEGECRSGA